MTTTVEQTTARRRLNIRGVLVDMGTLDEAVARCAVLLRAPGGLAQEVTVNPEFVMAAQSHAEFRAVLNGAALATADGVGIIWAARLLGRPIRERTTGVALVPRLADLAAREGYRLFLLGAGPGVAEAAGRVLVARYPGLQIAGTHAGSPAEAEAAGRVLVDRYPGLQIAGTHAGSPAEAEAAAIAARITASRADLLFVAFGAPAQDLWIARHAALLPTVRLAMGVGGVYDYLSGRVPLAPSLWRRLGLEWLYRLIHQPWRWRRMLALPRFVLAVAAQRFGGKQKLDVRS
jgi:N-acetylglucosaminyldiphosphoundecaprenol N-acetyl-beta-D-mannosaminyltransferase